MGTQQHICSCQPRFHCKCSGLTEGALRGRITHNQLRTRADLQKAAGCWRPAEAERHGGGQERAAARPKSPKSRDINTVRLRGKAERVPFTVTYTRQKAPTEVENCPDLDEKSDSSCWSHVRCLHCTIDYNHYSEVKCFKCFQKSS